MLLFGCATTPPGYDRDTTPGHDGANWIGAAPTAAVSVSAYAAPARSVMAAHIAAHPACAWCGATKRVEAHHVWPVSLRPDLAADPRNLVSLCRDCHFTLGHARDWRRAVVNLPRLIQIREIAP